MALPKLAGWMFLFAFTLFRAFLPRILVDWLLSEVSNLRDATNFFLAQEKHFDSKFLKIDGLIWPEIRYKGFIFETSKA